MTLLDMLRRSRCKVCGVPCPYDTPDLDRLDPPPTTVRKLNSTSSFSQLHLLCTKKSTMSTMLDAVYEYIIDDVTMQTHLICAPVRNFTLKGTKLGVVKYTDCCNEDSDAKIKVGNKVLRGHKACLRKISPMFASMLDADKKNTIRIDDFDIATVRDTVALLFQHDATSQFDPTPKMAYDMIRFAKKYELIQYSVIVSYLTDEGTVVPMLRDLYSTDKIVKRVLPQNVVEDNIDYKKIAQTPEFQKLDEAVKADFLKQCDKKAASAASLKAKQDNTKYLESSAILLSLYFVFKCSLDQYGIMSFHNMIGSGFLFLGLFALICLLEKVVSKK